jgi:hypothetical protein
MCGIGMCGKAQSAADGPCHWQGLQRRNAFLSPRRDRKHVLRGCDKSATPARAAKTRLIVESKRS